MGRINVLSKEVSELIAAGEVIERPSSVIKELLENSIDSGATAITVEIKNGGRTYMRLTDNGCGMDEKDVPLAFLRHATSKISQKDDLDSILTLGFRGEALASISAVSRVEVLTKQHGNAFGTHYQIEGSEEKLNEQTGCPEGTTIIIRDIFFNVPARLKFLKKDVTEGNNISGIVSKLALSHPEISFKFIRDNKQELVTAGDGKLYSAIYSVFGREYANGLIPVDYSANGIIVKGFVSKPLCARPNRSMQNFFINSRFVKSVTCMVALEEAFRNSIMTGRFPSCVLNLEITPSIVDVNVHPAKIEVRFSDEKLIYEAIFFSVKNALLCADTPTEMKLESTKHFSQRELYELPQDDTTKEQTKLELDVHENSPVSTSFQQPSKAEDLPFEQFFKTNNQPNAEPKYTQTAEQSSTKPNFDGSASKSSSELSQGLQSFLNELPLPEEPQEPAFKYINQNSFEKHAPEVVYVEPQEIPQLVKPNVIGEIFKTYILAQAGEDMLLIDKHAAHERYIFEQIKQDAKNLNTQMCIEPATVLLTFEEYDAVMANLEEIQRLGFTVDGDVAPNIAVLGVPTVLRDANPSDILPELARNFLNCKSDPSLSLIDELYHSIACKAAIKANDVTSLIELQRLTDLIYGQENIRYCPHGRPVMIKLSKRDIEKQFKRIV